MNQFLNPPITIQSAENSERRLSRRHLLEGSLAVGAAALVTPLSIDSHHLQTAAEAATPVASDELDAVFSEFDAFLESRMTELGIPGLAAGLIVGDRDHTVTFGVSNIDHPLPVDTQTLFQIGSTTKTVTATTLMRLVEQGELDWEAPVRSYLPDFQVADLTVSAEVQLHHLVTHTAGWYDDVLETETGDGDDALATYVESMASLPQVTPLGFSFSYNNSALSVAGRVIEAVTGEPYETAVSDLVLEPLGMENASFFAEEIITKQVAAGHDASGDELTVMTPWALPRLANPAGGMISTLDDQLRYACFHLGNGVVSGTQVLSADGLDQMRAAHGPGGTVPQVLLDNVGISWMLRNRAGVQLLSHAGGTYGQQSDLCLVPEHEFAVTTLTNATAGAILAIEATDWALDRFLGLTKPSLEPVSVAAEQLADYPGDYVLPENREAVRVVEDGGALRLQTVAAGSAEPDAGAPLNFIGDDLATVAYLGFPIFTDFVRDDAGDVAWIRYFGRMYPRAN